MLSLFVQNLYADGAATAQSPGLTAMIPWVLIFVCFYFLLIRPQQKKEQARQNMIKSLKKGDKVTTNGGIIGVIHKIDDKDVKIEVAPGVIISVLKNFVLIGNNTEDKAEVKKNSEPNTQPHKIKKNMEEKSGSNKEVENIDVSESKKAGNSVKDSDSKEN